MVSVVLTELKVLPSIILTKVQKSILQLDSLENYHEQRYRAYGITAPLDKQASNLYNLIKNEDVIKSTTVQIINLYKNQQISEFIKLEELFKTINKDFVQDIGTERNQLWMKKITKIIIVHLLLP